MKDRYTYINGLGRKKMILIREEEPNKYLTNLFDLATGEWCGNGYMTEKELMNFLEHYEIEI